MWGFILEVFPTFLHRIGLKFQFTWTDKSLELTKTRHPFPDGKGVDRAREKDSCFPFPYCKTGVCSAPSGQQLLSLQDKLSALRLKLFSLTLDCKPPECKQGQAGRSNLTSLSHFNDWTRLSEGCAHYCRIRWSSLVSSLFARPSKCTLLFAAL